MRLDSVTISPMMTAANFLLDIFQISRRKGECPYKNCYVKKKYIILCKVKGGSLAIIPNQFWFSPPNSFPNHPISHDLKEDFCGPSRQWFPADGLEKGWSGGFGSDGKATKRNSGSGGLGISNRKGWQAAVETSQFQRLNRLSQASQLSLQRSAEPETECLGRDQENEDWSQGGKVATALTAESGHRGLPLLARGGVGKGHSGQCPSPLYFKKEEGS